MQYWHNERALEKEQPETLNRAFLILFLYEERGKVLAVAGLAMGSAQRRGR